MNPVLNSAADLVKILKPIEDGYAVSHQSVSARDEILAKGDAIFAAYEKSGAAISVEDLNKLVEIGREAKGVAKDVEAVRAELKAPVLALGKKIDEAAKGFLVPITPFVKKVEVALSAHQTRERERVAREEEARQAAIRKAQIEEEEAAAALAAANALAASQAQALANPPTDGSQAQDEQSAAASEAAAAEAEVLKAQAEEALEVATKVADASVTVAKPIAVKPVGVAGRVVWCYEILDAKKVFGQRPEFFKLEEKRQVILGVISDPDFKCEGIKVWSENKSSIRGI